MHLLYICTDSNIGYKSHIYFQVMLRYGCWFIVHLKWTSNSHLQYPWEIKVKLVCVLSCVTLQHRTYVFMHACVCVCVCVCVLYACKQNPSTYWSKISKCHPEIRPSPQKMASMADLENWWRAAQMSSLFFFFFSECVCVCVRACVCSEWHVLTEHPHTCWLAVNKRKISVTDRNIFHHSSHVPPWLWQWSWTKGKQARPPPTSPRWRWEAVGVLKHDVWRSSDGGPGHMEERSEAY